MDQSNPQAAPKPAIGRHASPGVGSVNTWWVETEGGVVLVDAQRQASQAREVARAVGRIGKPVVAILLTHPHPDHVGGLAVLHDAFPDAAIHATARTAEVMRTDEGGLYALTRLFLGDDFVQVLPEVTAVIPDTGELSVGGMRFAHTEMGIGETVSACVFVVPTAAIAFVGDIVANGMTPWLLEGHTGSWLAQVDRLATLLPAGTVAYPGHGAEADAGTLAAAQRDYIEGFRELVAGSAKDGRLTDAARRAVVAETDRRHPGWIPVAGVPDLIAKNADGVARELGVESAANVLNRGDQT